MLAIFALASLTAVVPSTEFNSRSFILDGKPTLLLSGAVHYERVLPADWNRTFALMAEMGLNTVQTYVMWNFHEHKRGNATFEGRADIVRFVRTAQAHGLYAVVRIGPYICGEYMFGGYPLWLRDSGAKCFRCSDPVYMRESIAWVERLVNELVAKRALQPQGGNVLMLQIENEWNGEGSEVTDYLQATVDAARNITTLVPWILCHDVDQCTEINAAPGAPTDGKGRAICTINGFWEEERTVDPHQPSVAWLDALRAGNPQQPAMWTEDQGWFDQWGVAQRVRYSSDQAYGIMRAFANGLSYHNFYMVTGGSNFGLQAGGETVTAYAPDTVIDFLLLRHQPRFDYYGAMFRAIQSAAPTLLASVQIPAAVPLNSSSRRPLRTASPKLGLTTCYQYADASQEWKFNAADKSLQNHASPTLCAALDASSSGFVLAACDPRDPAQQFDYDASLSHVKNVGAEHACKAKAHAGEQCYECLDRKAGAAPALDAWDCKAANDPLAANQQWTYAPAAGSGGWGHVAFAASALPGDCLTALVPGPAPPPGGSVAEYHEYGPDAAGTTVAFLSNFGTSAADAGVVAYNGRTFYLSNHSVVLVRTLKGASPLVVFNSSNVSDTAAGGGGAQLRTLDAMLADGRASASTAASSAAAWTSYSETIGSGRVAVAGKAQAAPLEQLSLTDNDSDYLWYTTEISSADVDALLRVVAAPSVELKLMDGGVGYVYIDGVLLGGTLASSSAMYADRAARRAGARGAQRGRAGAQALQTHRVALSRAALRDVVAAYSRADGGAPSSAQTSTLQILSVAMGLANGGDEPSSGKGLLDVALNGKSLAHTSTWSHSYMLRGAVDARTPLAPPSVAWTPAAALKPSEAEATATWFRTTLDAPPRPQRAESRRADDAAAEPYPQLAYALDLSSMNKGVAYLNGFHLGRYWLIKGKGEGCAPPHHGPLCYMHFRHSNEPTQYLYHVPTSLLKPTGNELFLFEETAAVDSTHPPRDLTKVRIVALTEHPL